MVQINLLPRGAVGRFLDTIVETYQNAITHPVKTAFATAALAAILTPATYAVAGGDPDQPKDLSGYSQSNSAGGDGGAGTDPKPPKHDPKLAALLNGGAIVPIATDSNLDKSVHAACQNPDNEGLDICKADKEVTKDGSGALCATTASHSIPDKDSQGNGIKSYASFGDISCYVASQNNLNQLKASIRAGLSQSSLMDTLTLNQVLEQVTAQTDYNKLSPDAQMVLALGLTHALATGKYGTPAAGDVSQFDPDMLRFKETYFRTLVLPFLADQLGRITLPNAESKEEEQKCEPIECVPSADEITRSPYSLLLGAQAARNSKSWSAGGNVGFMFNNVGDSNLDLGGLLSVNAMYLGKTSASKLIGLDTDKDRFGEGNDYIVHIWEVNDYKGMGPFLLLGLGPQANVSLTDNLQLIGGASFLVSPYNVNLEGISTTQRLIGNQPENPHDGPQNQVFDLGVPPSQSGIVYGFQLNGGACITDILCAHGVLQNVHTPNNQANQTLLGLQVTVPINIGN